MAGERTEKATPKRLREAREQGQVPRSTDLTGTCVLAAGLLAIAARADGIAESARGMARQALGHASGSDFDPGLAAASLGEAAALTAAEFAPVLLAMVLIAIFVSFIQVGPIFTLEPLRPRLGRFDPLAGSWKRCLSAEVLLAPLMAALKFALVGGVAAVVVYTEFGTLLSTSRSGAGGASAMIVRVLARAMTWATGALFVLALLDLLHQRSKHAKGLRMSSQEKRAESRESQGNSHAKAARRRASHDLHAGAVADAVAQAHFVAFEPSGAACAFRWSPGGDAAPRLVAKGVGPLALRIVAAGRRQGVPVVLDVALARGGYQMEVGYTIGEELFDAARSVLGATSLGTG